MFASNFPVDSLRASFDSIFSGFDQITRGFSDAASAARSSTTTQCASTGWSRMKFPLGYVGVGLMGGPMVKRLTTLGWRVRGYDIVPERSMPRARLPRPCAGADVVLLNLPTNEAVEDVFGARLLPMLRAPQLVVDFSTIPVDACRAMRRACKATGCRWVDAPVSGGPPAVEARNAHGHGRRRSLRIWSGLRR